MFGIAFIIGRMKDINSYHEAVVEVNSTQLVNNIVNNDMTFLLSASNGIYSMINRNCAYIGHHIHFYYEKLV